MEDKLLKQEGFIKQLNDLINCHSMENESDTPDFILASFMKRALNNFNSATKQRTEWYSKELKADVEQIEQTLNKMDAWKEYRKSRYTNKEKAIAIINLENTRPQRQPVSVNEIQKIISEEHYKVCDGCDCSASFPDIAEAILSVADVYEKDGGK